MSLDRSREQQYSRRLSCDRIAPRSGSYFLRALAKAFTQAGICYCRNTIPVPHRLVIDATGMEANAAMKSVWRWKRGETHQEVLERLAESTVLQRTANGPLKKPQQCAWRVKTSQSRRATH